MFPTLEVCIDNARAIQACVVGGADRIELCSALMVGGLTPSKGLMQLAASCPLPVVAMIRPQVGGFLFGHSDVIVMQDDIRFAQDVGLEGVVLGAATDNYELDLDVLEQLCRVSEGIQRTLHRVIDIVADPFKAIDQAVELGFDRILTSGGAQKATDGISRLTNMQNYAAGRIEIMAGSGINADNVTALIAATGIQSVHSSCSSQLSAARSHNSNEQRILADKIVEFGFSDPISNQTDASKIKRLKGVIGNMP